MFFAWKHLVFIVLVCNVALSLLMKEPNQFIKCSKIIRRVTRQEKVCIVIRGKLMCIACWDHTQVSKVSSSLTKINQKYLYCLAPEILYWHVKLSCSWGMLISAWVQQACKSFWWAVKQIQTFKNDKIGLYSEVKGFKI